MLDSGKLDFLTDDADYKFFDKIFDSNGVQETLLLREIPDEVKTILKSNKTEEVETLRKILLLMVLLRFIHEYVYLVLITVDDEKFAFDIFESLNSTGDPLTAIETLKPLVVKYLTSEKFEKSNEKKIFNNYNKFLDEHCRPEERHKFTQNFVISLVLYEDGNKISKKLKDQSVELSKLYSLPHKRELCESISHLIEFYEEIWNKSEFSNTLLKKEQGTQLALFILYKANHTICIPLLARYYTELIIKNEDNPSLDEFCKVIKAVLSFSLIWRMLHKEMTDGIDDKYRAIIKTHICRRKNMPIPSVNALRNIFKQTLDIEMREQLTKEKFVALVSNFQYTPKQSNLWLKFFLMAALHDSIPDKNEPGLEIHGSLGSNRLLNRDDLFTVDPLTIEHISPQNPDSDDTLPEHLVQYVGNLTLLPMKMNSLIGHKNVKYLKF